LLFADLLTSGTVGIIAILQNAPTTASLATNQTFHLSADGVTEPLSQAGVDMRYASMAKGLQGTPGWSVTFWPTSELRARYETRIAMVAPIVVGAIFLALLLAFVFYKILVLHGAGAGLELLLTPKRRCSLWTDR